MHLRTSGSRSLHLREAQAFQAQEVPGRILQGSPTKPNSWDPFHCSIVNKLLYHAPLLRVQIATLARRRYARRLARTQSHGFPGFTAVTAGARGASREGTVARNADTRGKAGDAHAADDAGEDEEQACAQTENGRIFNGEMAWPLHEMKKETPRDPPSRTQRVFSPNSRGLVGG